MRASYFLLAGLAFAVPTLAEAQTIKARGAAAAGVCAGALDMMGGFVDRSNKASEEQALQYARFRDFFVVLPYDSNEIKANAQAFVQLMEQRIAAATNEADRNAIIREIEQVSTGCQSSAAKAMVELRARQGMDASAQPLPTKPQPEYLPAPQPEILTAPQPSEPQYIPQGSLD